MVLLRAFYSLPRHCSPMQAPANACPAPGPISLGRAPEKTDTELWQLPDSTFLSPSTLAQSRKACFTSKCLLLFHWCYQSHTEQCCIGSYTDRVFLTWAQEAALYIAFYGKTPLFFMGNCLEPWWSLAAVFLLGFIPLAHSNPKAQVRCFALICRCLVINNLRTFTLSAARYNQL